jgi:hypothetical protein
MQQLPAATQQRMQDVVELRTAQFDTEEEIWAEIRKGFNLGTAAVPSVNGEFASLYRSLVALSADDRNAVDPEKVRADDPRQAAEINNFMRDLKRAILRMTQNMSVYGTLGTARLVNKWSKVVLDSVQVLNRIATQNVESEDSDDLSPWSLLAAATDTPRGTVKAYIVNARNGGELLRLTVAIYDAIQAGRIPAGGGPGAPAAGPGGGQGDLDREDDPFLRALFFAKGSDIFLEPLKTKIGATEVSVALKKDGGIARDYVAQLWP